MVDHWENVLSPKDTFSYFPGTTEPDTDWYKPSYNPNWSKGYGGFGFGDGDDTTIISTSATSIYIIRKFSIKDTSKIYNALLALDYDDGFVAYLNGVEIARANMGNKSNPRHDSLAWRSHEAQMYQGGQPEYYYIQKSLLNNLLLNGFNYLCIQVHNVSAASNDLSCIPYLFVAINDTTTNNYRTNPTWFSPTLTTHLPIIVINTNGQGIPNDPSITADMGIVNNGFDQNHLTDSFNGYNGKITIQIRGSSSAGQPQRSYAWSTVDSAGNGRNVKILGMPKESDWILFGPYTDKTLMRNNLIYEISRQMGWYASRTEFAELILNNQYVGVYVVMEKIKWDKNRVDIPKILSSTTKGDSLTGGYIMKVDRVKQSGYGVWTSPITNYAGSKNYEIQTVNPDIPDITQIQANYIKRWMDSFENILYGGGYGSKLSTNYHKFIDVNSFIDFYICNEMTHNVDAYRLSCFLYKQKNSLGGRLYAGPIWDFNIALGNANYCNGGDTTGWSTCSYSSEPFWFDRLLEDPDYKKQFKCRWTSLRKDLLKTQNIYNWIDSVADILEVPQRRHYKQWQILGTYVWPNNYIGSTYAQEINYLKTWVRGRMNWMDKNMPNVTSSCKSTYSSSIIVSELNYNSHPNLDGGNWIELYNNSSSNINIAGYMVTDVSGFRSYSVPTNTVLNARSYIVLVEDTALFKKKYPNAKNFRGPMNWSLPNDTGTIRLFDALSYQVFQMGYSDKKAWPQGADGRGYTLELKTPGTNLNDPKSWMDGCIGGSPGKARTSCSEKLYVSEINYSSEKNNDAGDWFELHNIDTVAYNLKDYIIKDDNDTDVFVIKNNISIPPKGYLVVCNDTTKFKTIYPNVSNYIGQFNYGLNAKGDAIRIYNGFGTPVQKVYYSDSFPYPWGAKGTGYTIDFIDTCIYQDYGSSWQLSCYLGSPGKAKPKYCNPGQFANLVFTELKLLSDSKNNEGQWLELYNRDTAALDISNWKMTNSVGASILTFAKNTILPAKSNVILCNDTNAFKQQYPSITNYIGNFNYQISLNKDSLNIIDNTNYPAKAFVFDFSKYTKSNLLTRSIELVNSDSSDNSVINWMDGCLHATPSQTPTACGEPNYISEICYNNNFTITGDWLELYNFDTAVVDYSGYEIHTNKDSIIVSANTILGAKSYLAIVADSAKFFNHFFIRNYLVNNSFSLNDTLGIIKVYNNTGKLVYSNIYENKLPYDTLANGFGYTLNMYNDTLNPEKASSWRISCENGTPGKAIGADCWPSLNAKIVFNELSLWPDSARDEGIWVELYNKDTSDRDISNWAILNDQHNILLRFPNNYIMKANSYILLCSDTSKFKKWHPNVVADLQFTKNPDLLDGSLSITDYYYIVGGDVIYYNNPDSISIGAIHFGHTVNNTASVLHLINNSYWSAGCFGGTPGRPNNTCKDTIIVSEINYNSFPTKDAGDWVELYNPNKQIMDLSGSYIRTKDYHTWWQIPANTLVQADSFMVIVGDTALYNSRNSIFQSNIVYIPNFSLANDSDVIFIYNKDTQLMYSNFYTNGYVSSSNAQGFTMENMFKTSKPYSSIYWFAGCEEGSPGFRYTTPCPLRVKPVSIYPINVTDNVSIYPNPANTLLYIQFTQPVAVANGRMKIYDMNGKLVHEQSVNEATITLNVSNWNAGLYMLNLNGKYLSKFVVTK